MSTSEFLSLWPLQGNFGTFSTVFLCIEGLTLTFINPQTHRGVFNKLSFASSANHVEVPINQLLTAPIINTVIAGQSYATIKNFCSGDFQIVQ
jgi:hypothetical protein